MSDAQGITFYTLLVALFCCVVAFKIALSAIHAGKTFPYKLKHKHSQPSNTFPNTSPSQSHSSWLEIGQGGVELMDVCCLSNLTPDLVMYWVLTSCIGMDPRGWLYHPRSQLLAGGRDCSTQTPDRVIFVVSELTSAVLLFWRERCKLDPSCYRRLNHSVAHLYLCNFCPTVFPSKWIIKSYLDVI